ncbi:hypothetical protein KAR91_64435 [Candidatus Pacearchaeota archaeon]|nr:hypothetical protein [Candidatus Pacearchaeota archaeon]
MKPKIVMIKDVKFYEDQIKRLNKLGKITFYNKLPERDSEWLKQCKDADIICPGADIFKYDKLYKLENVFVSLLTSGTEFLDKKKMKERNITVSNSPGSNREAVSEWIIGMILMHFRRLSELSKVTKLSRDEILKATTSLYEKNITILGQGHIGKRLGKICKCFGMNVSFFKKKDNLIDSAKDADIIVNCLSVNPTTINLLDNKFFNSLKRGSFFVSTSRSQTYDIKALIKALNKGILIGAADDAGGIQVGNTKEKDYKMLLKHPKIIVTPHIAWNTDSRRMNDMVIDNIEAWLNKRPINIVK